MMTDTFEKYNWTELQFKALLVLLSKTRQDQTGFYKGRCEINKIYCKCHMENVIYRMMATSESMNKPTELVKEINLREVKVTLIVDDLKVPMFGNKQKAKNGEVDVQFMNRGFDMTATLDTPEGRAKWHYNIKKLPSQIDQKKSSWKVCNGMVVIHLYKKEEISWNDMLTCGLEQSYDSSDDETCSVSDVQTAF